MGNDSESRDFVDFRDGGSPEALARVFDAVAPRLLLLAGHLTRDAAQSEDLVQTTFLHAMRDAAGYDGARPVAAWLAGILRHRALDARRRGAVRAAEPVEEGAASSAPDAAALVADRELFERVMGEIERLDEPYRQVLVLRVVHELEPTEIAHALGRRPGTVRMQLKRGLERIRQVVPSASALLAVVLADTARGLSAVRAAVLSEAALPVAAAASTAAATTSATATALPTGTAVAAGATGTGILGGMLVMKATLAVAIAAGIGLTWYAVGSREAEGPTSGPVARPGAVARPADDASSHPLALPATAQGARVAANDPAASGLASSAPPPEADAPWSVRLLHRSGGGPVADVGVYLRAAAGTGLGREVRTDANGLAAFTDLELVEHEVHVDRLEEPVLAVPRPGETLDVWIPHGVRVTGRVVDLGRRPVANARVLRFNSRHHDLLQEVARTDAAGRFELLDAAPRSEYLARSAGFQPSELERMRDGDGERAELELVLGARGHTVRGQVVHADGSPAPFAWIAVGPDEDARRDVEGSTRVPDDGSRHKPMDREAFFLRADAAGRFASDEVPGGHTIFLARPLEGASSEVAWETLWIGSGGPQEVTLTLREGARLSGVVRDSTGLPVAGLALEDEWEGTFELGQMEDELGPWMSDRRAVSAADGSYVLEGLLPGQHDLRAIGERDTVLRAERVLQTGERAVWDPVVDVGASIRVRLLAPDGAPLAGWGVAASTDAGEFPGEELLVARTDEQGRRRIAELEAGVPHAVTAYAPDARGRLTALPALRVLDVLPGAGELELRLRPDQIPSATLEGSWVGADGAALAGELLALEPVVEDGAEGEDWEGEATAEVDERGRFRFDALPAGAYRLLTASGPPPIGVRLGAYDLGAGQRLDVGTLVRPAASLSRIVVELRVDGRPDVERAVIALEPIGQAGDPAGDRGGDPVRARFEQDGSTWTSVPVTPGTYRLRVWGSEYAPEVREVRVGGADEHVVVERRRGLPQPIELVLEATAAPSWLDFQVWDAAGRLIVDNQVIATGDDEAGYREVGLDCRLLPGDYRLRMTDRNAPGHAAEAAFTVADGELEPVRVDLR